VYTALSGWPAGEHHLVTTATFTSAINDGAEDYVSGDYILDYTAIPNMTKLGFEIMAVTLVKLKKELDQTELDKIWKFEEGLLQKSPFAYLMATDGHGLGYNNVVISLHENYSDFCTVCESH
jgi:hypothetical protein